MKHLIFPTVAQADAFVQDLQSQGVVQAETGQTSFRRRSSVTETGSTQATAGTGTQTVTTEYVDGGGDGNDIGKGALGGTAAGAVAGVAAGALVVATGGLAAVPVLLGMGALGSGIGAAAGAAEGAVHGHGLDDRYGGRYEEHYELEDTHYDQMSSSVEAGGRAVAVEDAVPTDVVEAAAARHGGRFVSGQR